MSKRPLKTVEKVLLAGGVLLAALPVAVAFLSRGINDEPNLAFPTPIPTPQPNGYDFYLRAGKAITPGAQPVDATLEARNVQRTLQEQKTLYSLARRQQWVKANAAGFAVLDQAKAMHSVEPTVVSKGFTTVHADFRQLGRYLSVKANTELMVRDYNAAFGSGLDVLQMASESSRGGGTLSMLTSKAIESLARPVLDESLEHLSAPQARTYQQRLTTLLKNDWTFQDATQVEKWSQLKMLQHVMKDPKWRNLSQWKRSASLKETISFRFIPQKQIYDNTVKVWDWAIEYAGQPYAAPAPSWPRMTKDPLSRQLRPTMFRTGQLTTTSRQTQKRFLACRLALHAHKKERGAYPASWHELNLAPTLNQDPFQPQLTPFGYKRQGLGYKIWSIGPDGKNDEGNSVSRRGTKFPIIQEGSQGDIVFETES